MKAKTLAAALAIGFVGTFCEPGAIAQGFHNWPGGGMGSPAESTDSYLGVIFSEIRAEDAEMLKLPDERGARIEEVVEHSPAEACGLQEMDVIVSWNGSRLESGRQLKRLVSETPPGRTVALDVVRDGAIIELNPEIGRHQRSSNSVGEAPWFPLPNWHPSPGTPDLRHEPNWEAIEEYSRRPKLGVMLQRLNQQFGDFLGVEQNKGVLVFEVIENTPAESAGFLAGDVIVAVGDEQTDTPQDVQRRIREASGTVEIHIVRNRTPDVLSVELHEIPSGNADIIQPENSGEKAMYPKSAM